MKTQAWFWIVMCAVGLAFVPCDASPGQDAAKESPAAPPQSQQPRTATIEFIPDSGTTLLADTFRFEFATHGNLVGVEVAPADPALRSQLNLADGVVIVTSITPDSEAAKAGLKQHDIVVNIDGHAITGPEKFNQLLCWEQGKKGNFGVVRQGKPLIVEVTLPKTPVYELATVQPFVFDTAFIPQTYRIGITLAEADDTLRSQLKLGPAKGWSSPRSWPTVPPPRPAFSGTTC